MTLLNEIQVDGMTGMLSHGNTSNISILNKFFARSYFARLWIVQELLLAQSITMHCGEASLTVTNESISQLYEHGVKVPSWVRFAGMASSNTEQAPLELRDLLTATSVCRVTDLRDKIFGLLGLISNVQASELSPDYELMVREVYIGIAAYLMQKGHCCDLIQHANPYWVRKWFEKDHQTCKNDYGIPSWVPLWDTDVPLQASQGIRRHIEQIELDSKHLLGEEAPFDCYTIRSIDGWPHDKNSECGIAIKCCKMVDSNSGFLSTRAETVLRLDPSFQPVFSARWVLVEKEDGEYFTGFWNLKDGLKLAIRSFAWALKCAVPNKSVHLIRVEGCAALLLAHQTPDSRKYRLLSSCVAAIVCQTRESNPAEMLNSDNLHHYLRFKPLTVEMIQFIRNWRNQIFELTASDPEDKDHLSSIGGQSCHYSSRDKPQTSHSSWRNWIPFLTMEAREMLEDDPELQQQLSNLVEFWHKAHKLHTAVRDWTKSALEVSDHVRIKWWYQFPANVKKVLEGLLQKSRKLGVAFETITGSRPILQNQRPLQLLLDHLANHEVKWTKGELLGYPGGLKVFFEDYDSVVRASDEDQLFLDQAFPLYLKDIHPEYGSMRETIELKPVLEGLVRENTEAKDIYFI
nr:hypothetical protein FVER53263_13202 [Fusarium verticillioides]